MSADTEFGHRFAAIYSFIKRQSLFISWSGKTQPLREGGMKATPLGLLPTRYITGLRAKKKNKNI
jgi:hypothetical protein